MKRLIPFLYITIAAAGCLAQGFDPTALKNSDGGRRVIAYFDAFNSGDEEKLKTFFAENISADSLKQRPVEPRVAFHKQVKSDFGKLEIARVDPVNGNEITVTARGSNGAMVSFTFTLSTDNKIQGMAVNPVDGPGGPAPAQPNVAAPANAAEVATSVEKLFEGLAKADQFSGVVLVAKDGQPVLTRPWGYADREKKIANTVDTKFNLGSINKIMTRIAIGQLLKAGKLSFSDKLISVLPDYPNKQIAEKVTIGQIVTMKSGLGDVFTDRYFAGDTHKLRTLKDYVPLFVDKPLEFEPGTKSRYSNAGYLVLGLVIEKLSGKNYYDYIRETIFEPAGMKDSGWFEIDKLPANTAIGYMKKGSPEPRPNTPTVPGRGSSAGGGYSTAGDLLKLAKALKSGKLVIPSDDGTLPSEFAGIGIAGGAEGINAAFLTSSKTGYTVIVLSNYDPPSAEGPAMQVNDWLKQIKQ